VWREDRLGADEAKIGVTLVVGKNDDDVRLAVGGGSDHGSEQGKPPDQRAQQRRGEHAPSPLSRARSATVFLIRIAGEA
jgi:hypothetical protein